MIVVVQWSDIVPHLNGLAHLATADADGRPAVAIVSPLVIDGQVWFQARRSSTKVQNLLVNPGVALMWEADGEVYVWGEADVIDDVATKQRLWSKWHYEAAGFFGAPDRPDVVVLRVTPSRASVTSAGPDGLLRRVWVP